MASANFVFNIAKGRVVELYRLVKDNIIAAAVFQLIPFTTGDTEANGQDADNITAVEALAFVEAGGAWGRKALSDSELASFPAPDDSGNKYDVEVPGVTWTGPAAANDTEALVIAMDITGSDADGVLFPMTSHVFSVTTDGNDVVLRVGDFFQAS